MKHEKILLGVWLISAILSLGITGFVIWAIWKLVMHFTS